MPRKKSQKRARPVVAGILGVGLDGSDGHRRLTRTEEMVLVGGSAETHERMQETAVRFAEALEKRGRRLDEVPAGDAIAMLRDAIEKGGG
jgi:hypothetical protein